MTAIEQRLNDSLKHLTEVKEELSLSKDELTKVSEDLTKSQTDLKELKTSLAKSENNLWISTAIGAGAGFCLGYITFQIIQFFSGLAVR